jgi:hypothetical protein
MAMNALESKYTINWLAFVNCIIKWQIWTRRIIAQYIGASKIRSCYSNQLNKEYFSLPACKLVNMQPVLFFCTAAQFPGALRAAAYQPYDLSDG